MLRERGRRGLKAEARQSRALMEQCLRESAALADLLGKSKQYVDSIDSVHPKPPEGTALQQVSAVHLPA
jgi:hypothetical protein